MLNDAVVLILTCSSHFCKLFSTVCCFRACYFTQCYHGIHHLVTKSNFVGGNKFNLYVKNVVWKLNWNYFCETFVQDGLLHFWAGKIRGGTFLKCLSKKLSGETLCKSFQIFPPKVLVYGGNIFPRTFLII